MPEEKNVEAVRETLDAADTPVTSEEARARPGLAPDRVAELRRKAVKRLKSAAFIGQQVHKLKRAR